MDFTAIFQAVITLAATIITVMVVPWIKAKTTAQQQETINEWIDVAVAAAEQIMGSGMGKEKMAYVVKYLADMGIKVTKEQIECSVYWLAGAITVEE